LLSARMYNGSGALGRLDAILWPFYQKDIEKNGLHDDEAIWHLACLLLRDTAYIQLGGPDADGHDVTNPVSYLVLEASHRLKIPANIGVSVGQSTDPLLLQRGVENLFADKTGTPKFLGVDETTKGFMRNGYSRAFARERAYSGCHWSAIPGREYTMNDMVKINLVAVFQEAWRELSGQPEQASVDRLWAIFLRHLEIAVGTIAEGLDFHLTHMQDVFPELVLDLLCHGTIERGLDASAGGVDFYNLCVDAAGLATVADSFAALKIWIELESKITWKDLFHSIKTDWAGQEGERTRLLMKRTPRFGHGGSIGDDYARIIAQEFTNIVKKRPTPGGYNMIPGLFSWASMFSMGKELGPTPNGRRRGDPISHGANPDPGFRADGAVTALAAAIASVQPGYGNTAPMQLDLDPGLGRDEAGIRNVIAVIQGHFSLGGTQINLNVLDKKKILEAHQDPYKYPDLIVRVTGFSAYFASLSPEFRQLVVDRIISES
jgi:pyruvate-formate lyase